MSWASELMEFSMRNRARKSGLKLSPLESDLIKVSDLFSAVLQEEKRILEADAKRENLKGLNRELTAQEWRWLVKGSYDVTGDRARSRAFQEFVDEAKKLKEALE